MDHIRGDCSASEKIIKKLSLLGASTTHYALATSLILKLPSLISFSEMDGTVRPGRLLRLLHSRWSHATPSVCAPRARKRAGGSYLAGPHGAAGRHCSSVFSRSSFTPRGSGKRGRAHCLRDLGQDSRRGPQGPGSLRFPSGLLHGPATGMWDTSPEPVSFAAKGRLGPASQGVASVSFAPSTTSHAGHHHALSCSSRRSYQPRSQE